MFAAKIFFTQPLPDFIETKLSFAKAILKIVGFSVGHGRDTLVVLVNTDEGNVVVDVGNIKKAICRMIGGKDNNIVYTHFQEVPVKLNDVSEVIWYDYI